MNAALAPLLALLGLGTTPLQAQDQSQRARTLFLVNCATCHGETGDGQGVTELDRPARSFKDGGFSFGNTQEALFRTISVGIAGTPMPGFDSSLSEDDRRLLADYVVTLGPPIEEVRPEDTVLSVHDRPVVVRGLLPPMADGLPSHPRGLLVGDPSGITFEYQVDDVRLLGLRQGAFVRRTDWTGRGGTALEPLGKVVHLVEGGKPEALFRAAGSPLAARLSGTRIAGAVALEYHLVVASRELAHVEESPSVISTPFGTGYERRFRTKALRSGPLQLCTPTFQGGALVANGTWDGKDGERWLVVRPGEGAPVYVGLRPASSGTRVLESTQQLELEIAAGADESAPDTVLTVLVLTSFDPDVMEALRRWRGARR